MKENRNLIRWLLVCAGIILTGLIIVSLSLPRLIDLGAIREKVVQTVSREFGGTVTIEGIDTGIIPPRLIFHGTALSIPGRVNGSIAEISIHPRLLSLIQGKVELSGVSLRSPDLKISLPDTPQKKDRKQDEPSLSVLQNILIQASSKASGLSADILQGRITIESGKHSVTFDKITASASFNVDNVRMKLHCTSPFLEKAAFSIKISPETFRGDGELTINRFMPQKLPETLAPALSGIIDEAEGDIHLKLSFEDAANLHAEAKASFPRIVFSKEKGSPVISMQEMEIAYDLRGREEELTLKKLTCSNPAISLSGRLLRKGDGGRVALELTGEKADIGGLRSAALAVLPDIPVVRNIFGYLQGGKIPRIVFHTDGESVDTLGRTENISIEGSLSEGKVYIQGPDLLLDNVTADVVIRRGILKGSNITAVAQGVKAVNGTVRVGLRGKDAPIHIDSSFRSSAADAVRLVRHLTRSSELSEEMTTARDMSGSAEGRVVIGEKLDAINVAVDAPNMSISAVHAAVPSRLTLHGLSLIVRGKGITVNSAGFSLGQSRFTAKGDVLFRDKGPVLDMDFSSVRFVWEDIAGRTGKDKPTVEFPGSKKKGSQSIQGTVRVKAESFDFAGYLFSPFRATIVLKPKVTNITVKEAQFCGILTSGIVNMSQDGIGVEARFEAQNQEVRPTILCLSKSRDDATGVFALKAELQGKGRAETLSKNIKGTFDFSAKDGSISRMKGLDSVFDFLNEGEEVKGQLPDLDRAAFKYKLLKGKGTLSSSSLKLDEAVLESDAVHLVSQGRVDFSENTLDLDVMVAVNKTADTVIRKTPVIGTILGGSLISVPVKVRGSITEPQVIYLSPSAAVSNLTDMMRRTAGLPLEVLSPFLPKRKE